MVNNTEQNNQLEINKQITVISDYDGVLLYNKWLAQTLSGFKDNGVNILVWSEMFDKSDIKDVRKNGLDIDYDTDVITTGKTNVNSFKRQLEQRNLNPNNTIFLDDSWNNCDAAQKAGCTTIRWSNNHEGPQDELNDAVAAKGYKPVFN